MSATTVPNEQTDAVLRDPERINLAGEDTGRDHLSNYALGTLLTCQQQFAYHYEHRLSPAITKPSLADGRAFAHALEHNDPDAGEVYLREQAAVEKERAADSPWIVAPSDESIETEATVVREAARCYLNHYGAHDTTREVELRARIRNPAPNGRYSLTHDLMCRVDAVSADWLDLYEDKLVGQIPRKDFGQLVRLDRQVSIETYLIWRTQGVLVERVHYRMTLKPAIRQRKGESFDGYLERIAEEYATRPDHYLAEETAQRTEDDFLRLEREMWRWADQLRESRRDGTWPRNTGACRDYGGCRYLALCSNEPGAIEQFIERPRRDQVCDESEQSKEVAK